MTNRQFLHFVAQILTVSVLAMAMFLLGLMIKAELVEKELKQVKSVTIERYVPTPKMINKP